MPKHAVYVYNKKKKMREHRQELHIDGKSELKSKVKKTG
jgi:hypothetical protein